MKKELLILLMLVTATETMRAQNVPEHTNEPLIEIPESEEAFDINFYAEDGAAINATVNGETLDVLYGDGCKEIQKIDDEQSMNIEAYAQETGKALSEVVAPYYVDSAMERTSAPTIILEDYYEGEEDSCYYQLCYNHYRFGKKITIVNNDDDPSAIIFYRWNSNGEWISGDRFPIQIIDEGEYAIEAYAQAEGKLPSTPVRLDFSIEDDDYDWCFNFIEGGIYYVYLSDSTLMVCPPVPDDMGTGPVGNSTWYIGDIVVPRTVNHRGKTYAVTEIGPKAFSSCSEKKVSLPNTITRIRYDAFINSTLTEIDIPASVTGIDQTAFMGTPYLERLHVDEGNPVYDSRENCNAIIVTATKTLIQACKTTVIPSSVPIIGQYAFGGDIWPMGVPLPDVYTLPGTVTTICDQAFYACNMKKLLIPNSVTSIGEWSFASCYNLESVDLPESLLKIGMGGFGFNRNIKRMISRALVPPDASEVVYSDEYGGINNYEQATLFVPAESLEAYQTHEEWGRFTHIVPFIGAGPGDINGDGSIAINDATNLIDMLLGGEELPAYADVNGDSEVTIKDVTDLIDMMLEGH